MVLKKIILPFGSAYNVLLDFDDLIYCEQDEDDVMHYYTTQGITYKTKSNEKILKELLEISLFYKISNSLLINLNHIKIYNTSGELLLSNGKSCNILPETQALFYKLLKKHHCVMS